MYQNLILLVIEIFIIIVSTITSNINTSCYSGSTMLQYSTTGNNTYILFESEFLYFIHIR